jgi:hypothetical protein
MNEILRPYKCLENVMSESDEVDISKIEKVFRPKKKGRPRKDNIFYTILILKGYFTLKLSRPNWPLIADILNLYCQWINGRTYDYSSVESSWVDMKKNYICMRKYEIEFSKRVYDQYLKSQEHGGNNG